jgi:hypothetical protein
MLLFRIAGWALLAAGIGQALTMWTLDQRMQRHRRPDASPANYVFIPVRWQRRLYTDAGKPLVGEAWRATFTMYALALLGAVLVAIGSPGG